MFSKIVDTVDILLIFMNTCGYAYSFCVLKPVKNQKCAHSRGCNSLKTETLKKMTSVWLMFVMIQLEETRVEYYESSD